MTVSEVRQRDTQEERMGRRRGVAAVRGAGKMLNRLPTWAAVLLIIVVVLALWQLVVSLGTISELVLPSPLSVGGQLVIVTQQLIGGEYLLGQLWITIQEVLLGFGLAVTVGITVGLIVGQTEFGRKGVMPIFVLLDATPKIAFAPVFIAWFGFGIASKFLMAAFMSIFPIIVGTAAGLAATSEEEIKLFRSMKASGWDIFWKLKVHRALPFVFTGLKIAVVAAVTGAVAAEFIGGGIGFGEQVRVAAARIALDRVFALILYLSVLGLLLYLAVAWLQKKLTFWDQPGRDR
ncbi:ABC transporter permease [Ornithinimicrobium cavernae]|uniref:ABC transporter permease n=1 Tax=Ornithinimicrobium cavernae TaxID=2666047 RepID=UPI000D6A0548|nr:ABC transporter permease [Ornithinimicrobium cavernae]